MALDIDSPFKAIYKPIIPTTWIGSTWKQKSVLALLFVFSFMIPVLFGLKILGSWIDDTPIAQEEADPVFPDNIAVQSQGAFLKISDHVALTPNEGSDYLLSVWFNLKRMPNPGESMSLISKVDHKHPLKPGFSLSLARSGSLVRPVMYWKDNNGKGGWYHFSDIRILPRSWFSFVLSVQDAQVLGLHMIRIEEGKKPSRDLLGGFKLSVPVSPLSESPLYVGSLQSGTFRGKIGPISVFAGTDMKDEFRQIIKEISRDPLSIPASVASSQVMLWCPDGRDDRSAFNHVIVRSKAAERGTKK